MSHFDDLKDSKIRAVYEVVGEWEVIIGHQTVKIKVLRDEDEKYYYRTSDYYKGSEQAGPYISSINRVDSLIEALYHAKRQITSFYNPDDPMHDGLKTKTTKTSTCVVLFCFGVSDMPTKPKRPCNRPGCRKLTAERFCEQHRTEEYKRQDRERGTAAERGYGYRWQKYRAWFLKENQLCAECKRQGKLTAATLVDHIVPVTGPDDPLFWDTDNHQPLCDRCHNIKRATEDKETWRKRRNERS